VRSRWDGVTCCQQQASKQGQVLLAVPVASTARRILHIREGTSNLPAHTQARHFLFPLCQLTPRYLEVPYPGPCSLGTSGFSTGQGRFLFAFRTALSASHCYSDTAKLFTMQTGQQSCTQQSLQCNHFSKTAIASGQLESYLPPLLIYSVLMDMGQRTHLLLGQSVPVHAW
jgi:hypothetical protein